MASVFIELLTTEEVISNYIIGQTMTNNYSVDQIEDSVCKLLQIKSPQEIKGAQSGLKAFIEKLIEKNVFNRDKNCPQRVPFINRALDYQYQKTIEKQSLDLRFFIQRQKTSKDSASPMQKQIHLQSK